MPWSTKCDECGHEGRLHVDPDHNADRHFDKDRQAWQEERAWLLCDECWEKRNPGLVAVCEDYCGLPLDHLGVCRQE